MKATFYYENGTVCETGFYKNGKMEGHWSSFNLRNEKVADGYFHNNKKAGTWCFYRNGELTGMANFYDDMLVTSVSD